MKNRAVIIFILAGLLSISSRNLLPKGIQGAGALTISTNSSFNDSVVYKTGNLIILRLTDHVYQHISFLNTNDFGKVDCNGMIVINKKEAIVFDTPSDDKGSGELINYITRALNSKIKAIIPTHFHEDCVGGLEKFNEHNIPAYASGKTIELLKNKGRTFSKPLQVFEDSLVLAVGDRQVYVGYFGEGHTKDNVVGYFPDDNALFGGCLIKEAGAKKGNLADANVDAWSGTVSKLKQKYPNIIMVIPGHGKNGGMELLDYTIKLFE